MSNQRSGQLGSTARGYNYRWQKARERFLEANPLCVMCKPRVVSATVVDHIIPHKKNQALFWDESNWQALCAAHHSRDKQIEERGGKPRLTIGADGWPIE